MNSTYLFISFIISKLKNIFLYDHYKNNYYQSTISNFMTGLQADAEARSCLFCQAIGRLYSKTSGMSPKFLPMRGAGEQLMGYFADYTDLFDILDTTGEMQAPEGFIPRSTIDPVYLRYLYQIAIMPQQEFIEKGSPRPEGIMQFKNDPSLWIGKNFKMHADEAQSWYFEEETHQMHDYSLGFGMRGQSSWWQLVIEGDICILKNGDEPEQGQPNFCMVLNQHFRLRLARYTAVTLFVILKLKVLLRRAKKDRRLASLIFPKLVFRFDGLIAREISSYCWGRRVFQAQGARYPRWLDWLVLLPHQSMRRVDRIFKPPLQGREYDLLMVRDVLNQFLKRRLAERPTSRRLKFQHRTEGDLPCDD